MHEIHVWELKGDRLLGIVWDIHVEMDDNTVFDEGGSVLKLVGDEEYWRLFEVRCDIKDRPEWSVESASDKAIKEVKQGLKMILLYLL